MILTQYCHQLGKECDLKAVISVCACMDPFATKHSLENQYINRNFYTAFLTNEICDIVERYYIDLHVYVEATPMSSSYTQCNVKNWE